MFSDINRIIFSLLPLIISCRIFLSIPFIGVRKVPYILSITRVFIINECWILPKIFYILVNLSSCIFFPLYRACPLFSCLYPPHWPSDLSVSSYIQHQSSDLNNYPSSFSWFNPKFHQNSLLSIYPAWEEAFSPHPHPPSHNTVCTSLKSHNLVSIKITII